MKVIKDNLKYVVIVLLIVIFTISIVPKDFQNDTFYTIAVGKHIVKNGISDIEPFAWHEGLEYQTPHWFFDYLNALIYNVFELEGLYVFICALSVIFMLVIYFNMVSKGINWGVAYIATMITAYLLSNSLFTDRAQILSYLLFFIEVTLIESFMKRKSKLAGFGLFVIAVLVANLHAGVWPLFFVLFLPYIGEYVINWLSIKEVVRRRIKRDEKRLKRLESHEGPNNEIEKLKIEIDRDKKYIKFKDEKEPEKIITEMNKNALWLILIMFICLFAGLLTPRPEVPYTYFAKISAGTTMNYISEHRPVVIAGNFPFLLMVILSFTMIGFTDSKIKLSHALLLLGLGLMSCIAVRHVVLLMIFGSYIITKMIDDFIKKYGHEDIEVGQKKKIKNIFFILLCIVISAFSIYFFTQRNVEEFIDETMYPVKATEWIKKNLNIEKIKLYNEYDFGSYLLYQGVPVFIDSRSDLYTQQFNENVTIFDDLISVVYGEKSYREIFEKYDITHALVYKSSIANTYMKEDGVCFQLYEDDYFVLYQYTGNSMK